MNADSFLAAFFGDGNEIRLAQAEQSEVLRSLLGDVAGGLKHPAVLPRRTGEQVDWFVLCRDDTQLRATQSEVQAFIGPSYGRWDGVRANLRDDDPVERALKEFVDGRVLRFQTRTNTEFGECWSAVQVMRSVWQQRPSYEPTRIRSGAALLTDFELAIAAGNRSGAQANLTELRNRGMLGAENIRFLEIRLLAADGLWTELAESPDLSDLAMIRRPWLVTEDLLTALYRTRIARYETADDVAGAVAAISQLVSQFPGLLGSRGPLRSADVLKVTALRLALPATSDADEIRQLAQEPTLISAERAWLEHVAEAITTPTAPRRLARDAFAQGDRDDALALALAEAPSAARAALLIECAYELQSLASAELALGALDALTSEDRQVALERRLIATAAEQLRMLITPLAGGPSLAPRTWSEWLQTLIREPDWPAAQAVAACGELEYTAEDLADPERAAALPELVLQVADSGRRETLRDALPRIVGWLERQDLELAESRPLHEAVLTTIALDTVTGEGSLETAYNATEVLLRSGLDEAQYRDLLDQLELIWARAATRRYLTWLADVLELLISHPGSRDGKLGFAATVLGPVFGFVKQVERNLLGFIADQLETLGATELAERLRMKAVSAASPAVAKDALDGRLVGIYTLTPQVAVRARDAIERRFPGVEVQTDASHVSTPALEQLAGAADYLIVSLRSAKHAATDAISRYRDPGKPTVIPRGRGSSRIVEALVAAIAAEQRAAT